MYQNYAVFTRSFSGLLTLLFALTSCSLADIPSHSIPLTAVKPHRGGAGEFPENTLHAYRQNLKDGTSLDMDIRRTADGDIVVLHDLTTGRTCNENWVATEKTVAELQTLDAAWTFDPAGDQSIPLRGQGIQIPTLAEAFAMVSNKLSPGAIIWIDTKDDSKYSIAENAGLYDRLAALIGQFDLWEVATIEVGAQDQAEALKSRDSRIRTAYWASDLQAVRDAVQCPLYMQIGVQLTLAAQAASLIKGAGKELQINDKRFTIEEWNQLLQYQPDFIGTDYYQELLQLAGIQ
jgi:hypothetical protein